MARRDGCVTAASHAFSVLNSGGVFGAAMVAGRGDAALPVVPPHSGVASHSQNACTAASPARASET
jgi:hypothetical protein